MAVGETIELLRTRPHHFELVREGKSLYIKSKLPVSYSKVRLDPWGISLCMAADSHVTLSPKESRLLNKAVHRWLS